jgi:hypothetical protein
MQLKDFSNVPKGSFGLPPEAKKALEEKYGFTEEHHKKKPQSEGEEWLFKKTKDEEEAAANLGEEAKDPGSSEGTQDSAEEPEEKKVLGPIDVLRSIGIEVSADDFHALLFRGFVEKTISIASNPINGKTLTAKLKTLTSEEFDLVDELLGEDLDRIKITNSGAEVRRAMWGLSFGIIELNGKPICTPSYDKDKNPLLKETAQKRRAVLAKLNPFVLNRIIELHTRMTASFSILVTSPEYSVVKK